jgi:hypothetical protein
MPRPTPKPLRQQSETVTFSERQMKNYGAFGWCCDLCGAMVARDKRADHATWHDSLLRGSEVKAYPDDLP